MTKNNLSARVAAWEAEQKSGKGSKTQMHKPGSQKK